MKKLQEYLNDKEKSKVEPKKKTPFKDFVEEREDLSFKFTDEQPDFFFLEDNQIKYKSETGEYVTLVEAEGKENFVKVKAFDNRIVWRYIDEMVWHSINTDREDLIVEDGFIEFKSTDNWAKISVSRELLPEEAGIPGLDGKDGKDGKDGLSGKDGKQGRTGKPGKKGEQGVQGKPGVPGKDGKDGVQGIPGKDGIGIDGLSGKDGKNGRDGKDGLNGSDGIDGKDGKQGKSGKDGLDGLNGTDGISGKDGKSGKDGTNGTDGKDGLQGRAGRVGKTGPKGIDGRDGKDGKNGAQGPKGEPGPPGKSTFIKEDTVMTEGPIGPSGQDGVDGKDGIDGKDGHDGKDGRDGVDGRRGPVGLDGRDGKDGREIEMKSEHGAIYWKYVDEIEWDILIDLSKKTEKDRFKDILDKAGIDDEDKPLNFPQAPMLAGGMRGAPGAPGVAGEDGPGVEMKEENGIIYWRQEGDTDWIELVDLSTIIPDTPPGEGISISKNNELLGSGISSLDFLSDGEITVVNGVATITLGEDMKYTALLDFAEDYIYKGEAVPGSAGANESNAIWRISRTYIDPVTDDIDIMWADGVITFDKIWDNHLTYTYS